MNESQIGISRPSLKELISAGFHLCVNSDMNMVCKNALRIRTTDNIPVLMCNYCQRNITFFETVKCLRKKLIPNTVLAIA